MPSHPDSMPDAPGWPRRTVLLGAVGAAAVGFARPGRAAAFLGEAVLGSAEAPVTIIEYASMTCPHCATFSKTTFPALKAKYIDTGKVRFIFREFPLDELAVAASMMARCVGGDKSMAMIDVLFASQDKWAVRNPLPQLQQITKQAGMSQQAFEACLADQKLYNDVLAMRERGSKEYKVESTPTLFVNGKPQKGGATMEQLEKLIDPLLPKS